MLNIEVNRSAEGVERYFDRELSVSNYFIACEHVSRVLLDGDSGGLFAISLGLSAMHPGDDQAVLRDGFIVYDASYRWLKFCREEKHLWFPPAVKPSSVT